MYDKETTSALAQYIMIAVTAIGEGPSNNRTRELLATKRQRRQKKQPDSQDHKLRVGKYMYSHWSCDIIAKTSERYLWSFAAKRPKHSPSKTELKHQELLIIVNYLPETNERTKRPRRPPNLGRMRPKSPYISKSGVTCIGKMASTDWPLHA